MTTTALMPIPKQQYISANGIPIAGGNLYTYAAGSNTPKQTFTDSAGTVPQPNPIPLNARGEPTNAIFWSGSYKVVLYDALGNLIYSVDNYNTDPAGLWTLFATLLTSVGASMIGFIQAGVGAVLRTLQAKAREWVSPADYGNDITVAIAALSASGGGTLRITRGTYNVAANIVLKNHVDIIGEGEDNTIINYTGTTAAFVSNESIVGVKYEGFTIKNSANANAGVKAMVFNYGISKSKLDFKFIGKGGDVADGIVIYGTANNDGVTGNNNQYENTIDVRTETSGAEITGVALRLEGKDVANSRCNANMVTGTFDGFTTSVKINGNGNTIGGHGVPTFNGPNTAGAAVHLWGNACFGNVIINPYFDGAIVGSKVKIENTAAGELHMVTVIEPVNSFSSYSLVDASSAGTAVGSVYARGRIDNERFLVSQVASNATLLAGHSGEHYAFTGTCTLTLPPAVPGQRASFSKNNAGAVATVTRAGADVIRYGATAVRNNLLINTNSNAGKLECYIVGVWELIYANAAVTDDGTNVRIG